MASLVGVSVSHVIVLFDFIEVMQERGEPLREAYATPRIVPVRLSSVAGPSSTVSQHVVWRHAPTAAANCVNGFSSALRP